MIRKAWATLLNGQKKFSHIDGAQRAAAFAYYTFFSLFPLIILFTTIISTFIDQTTARRIVIGYIASLLPVTTNVRHELFKPIVDFMKVHTEAGIMATIVVIWSSINFIKILTHTASRAWDEKVYDWLELPLKSLVMLVIMIVIALVGMTVPAVSRLVSAAYFKVHTGLFTIYKITSIIIPFFVMFFGISIFYKIAPRRKLKYSEVCLPALFVTILLSVLSGIVSYLFKFFDKFYGCLRGSRRNYDSHAMDIYFWLYNHFWCVHVRNCDQNNVNWQSPD